MTGYDFVFSDKPSARLLRHISFWMAFSIHFFIQGLLIPGVNEALTPRTPPESLLNISFFLPIYLISVYTFIEIIIPGLLFKGRYTLFFIAATCLLIFNFIACLLAGILYLHIELKIPYDQVTFADNKYHAIVNGLFVSAIILSITGGIKIAKKWFQKQRENETLAQQKISSELQLLKIQINPRFLFHSLHSVKQHILADSPRAPRLILQVADLLSYILYESDRDHASLAKELGIVHDYLGLEENTISENLQMKVTTRGDANNKYITPLILLSIIEAGFEYFLKNNKERFSSKLFIDIHESRIDLKMAYETPGRHLLNPAGLEEKFRNVRRQLRGLYPLADYFNIESVPGYVNVYLRNFPLHVPTLVKKELQPTNETYENI